MERSNTSNGDSHSQFLPIIDFAAWTTETTTNSSDHRLEVAHELVEALRRTGFVYIINHGVPSVKEAFAWSKKVFDLPLEKKEQVARDQSTAIFRGYNTPGLQRVPMTLRVRGGDPEAKGFSPDWNETYDTGSDENTAMPNIWLPEDMLPGFRQFSNKFYGELWKAAENIFYALALGLGIDEEDLIARLHSYSENSLSYKHYPAVPASDFKSHEKERLGSHSDLTSVTLLFQDDCGGLEVEKQGKRGEFFPVDPVEGSMIVNIGDVLMRWSNDQLLSAVHRVQPPLPRNTDENNMTRERYSIVYFVSPTMEQKIECLPGCSDEKNPARYPPRGHKELIKDYSQLFYPEGKVF